MEINVIIIFIKSEFGCGADRSILNVPLSGTVTAGNLLRSRTKLTRGTDNVLL